MKPGRLSSLAAGAIDKIYLESDATFLQRLSGFLRIRALLIGFFVLNIIDMFTSLTIAATFAIRSLFTSERTQENRLSVQAEYATLFGRSFYAFLATPISFFLPKLVIFYFTPEKNETGITAGGNYSHEDNVEIIQPKTSQELASQVRNAINEGRKIIPMGAGRSQGQQFIPATDGDKKPLIVDLRQMNDVEVHTLDTDEPYAWVGAGTLWSKLQVEASKRGAAIKVMQASNVFSVGGSIGTNIHGWDYHAGMLSNCIDAMEIVDVNGDLRELDPKVEADVKLFNMINGGYGLYGIVTRVKMKLAINEYLGRETVDVAPSEYLDYFNRELRNDESKVLHLYRLSLDPNAPLSQGFTETYARTNGKPVIQANLDTEPKNGTRFQRVMVNVARRFPWAVRLWWNNEHQEFLDEHPTATRNEIMQAPINAMFNSSVSEGEWLQEYFIPGESLADFLNEFGTILKDSQVSLLNATVRFVKQNDKNPLSYAHDGDRFAVVICFNQSLQPEKIIQAKKWLRQAQELSVEKGGSYYLPYQHVSSPEVFERSYPHAQKARDFKQEIDPNNHFASGLHKTFLAQKTTFAPLFIHQVIKNAQTREQFKGFLNTILQRLDSEKLYRLLDDILEYEDSHEGIYRELCSRLPEVMPSAMGDIRNKLSSLAAIKKDLGDQARALLPADFEIDGDILEFGSPGRYAKGLAEHYKQTGQIIAVDDAPTASFMHYIDAGTTHPYDKYMHLDYSNMDLSSIGDKSVKVMTCYVGLHHFSDEALDRFLTDVKRILKDDGHFLLVDHDIDSEQTLAMAHMAHMVFNAVNDVSLQDELTEIRNFQPMTYWQQKLREKGIPCEIPNQAMIRQGDPTRNQMMMGKNTTVQLENRSVYAPIIADEEEEKQSDEAGQRVFARRPVFDSSVATSDFTLFANSNPTQNNGNQAAPEGDSRPASGL